jgi:hypothetical protein
MNNPNKPEIYQGFNRKEKYFEGWYFKSVTADKQYSIALIPGISLAKKDPHAFIQVFVVYHGEPTTLKHHYVRFAKEEFVAKKDVFHVAIGRNEFSLSRMHLHIHQDDLHLEGDVLIEGVTPINRGFLNPSIMGPFAYLPRMECYHGVLSMIHTLKGQLSYQGKVISFQNGKGYIEKDWGTSFPSAYVWMQANHFAEKDVSVFFSVATIPYLGLSFQGLIAHIYIQGKHYRFATYNGGKILQEKVSKHHVEYILKKGHYRLKIIGEVSEVADLPSPKYGKMDHTIKEGLSGKITFWLMHKNIILYQGESGLAGIEIMKV